MKKVFSVLLSFVMFFGLMNTMVMASEDCNDFVISYYININPDWNEDDIYAETERIINTDNTKSDDIFIKPFNILCDMFGCSWAFKSERIDFHYGSDFNPHEICYYYYKYFEECTRCKIRFNETLSGITMGHYDYIR